MISNQCGLSPPVCACNVSLSYFQSLTVLSYLFYINQTVADLLLSFICVYIRMDEGTFFPPDLYNGMQIMSVWFNRGNASLVSLWRGQMERTEESRAHSAPMTMERNSIELYSTAASPQLSFRNVKHPHNALRRNTPPAPISTRSSPIVTVFCGDDLQVMTRPSTGRGLKGSRLFLLGLQITRRAPVRILQPVVATVLLQKTKTKSV